MTSKLFRATASMAAVALLLTACGDSDDDAVDVAEAAEEAAEEAEEAAEEVVEEAEEAAEEVADEAEDMADEVTEETTPATDPPAPAVDVAVEVGLMMNALPEGWLSLGSVEDFEAAVEATSPMIIDVRETSDYEAGHIPNAVSIPIRTLADHVDQIPMDSPVIVYCASGYRAAMSTIALRSLGYENVRAFGGSYKAWTAAERDVSTDPVELPEGTPKAIAPELLDAVAGYLGPMPEGYLNVKDVELMQAAMDTGAYVVDVREVGEYEEGHIPGAVNVPLRTIIDGSADFPTDRQIVVYCKSGYRAAMANAALGIAGFDNVKAFAGSWLAWTDAGLEVEV